LSVVFSRLTFPATVVSATTSISGLASANNICDRVVNARISVDN